MPPFQFKYFQVEQNDEVQKVGTDALILGALVESESPQSILDIGAGTGVIALILAQRFTRSKVVGIDVNLHAFPLLLNNFQNSPYKDRMEAVHEDFLSYSSPQKYDLIVSNPPYFKTQMYSENTMRNLARHEGKMRVPDLIQHAETLLSEKGKIWIIVPVERVEELLEKLDPTLFQQEHIRIYGKPNRWVRSVLVFARARRENIIERALTIRDEDGNYTQEYKALTKELHGKSV